ncbi:MAG TPA: type II secretion system protein GspL [Gammaproteobacteria bacterium]
MSQRTLYIRFASGAEPLEWLLLGPDGGRRTGQAEDLAALAHETAGARLVVLLPATEMTLARVTLPPVKRAQQRQAALFALEDQLVDDIAELHAAFGERGEDGTLPLVVVSRERMHGWMAQLNHLALRPDALVDELLMVPLVNGEWSVLWEERGVRVRTGAVSGVAFETELWPLLWPRLLAEAGEQRPPRLRVFDARSEATAPLPLDDALPGGEVTIEANRSSLRWVEVAEGSAPGINLLQGDFSLREQWGRKLRPWRPAAALFLLWLVIQGGMAFFDMRTLSRQELQLNEQMEALYRKSFPDARKVVEPRTQMEQKLAALKNGDSGFMKLAVSVAPALRNSLLKGMRYQDGALDLDISFADMATLDTLRSTLESKGLAVEIGNVAQQEGRVESRLTLRGGGA